MEQVKYKRVLDKILQVDKDIPDKFYIMDYKSAVSVNEIGARIFELCDGMQTVDDICVKLETIFDVGSEILRADVTEYLALLLENKIVRECVPV